MNIHPSSIHPPTARPAMPLGYSRRMARPIDPARVKARRKELRLTQAQLADRAGTTQASISRAESGDSQLLDDDQKRRLARALETTVDELCGADEPDDGPRLEPDEDGADPFDAALTAAFARGGFTFDDVFAVRSMLTSTMRRLASDGDLPAGAEHLLRAARSLRKEGRAVTIEALLSRAVFGRSDRAEAAAMERGAAMLREADKDRGG